MGTGRVWLCSHCCAQGGDTAGDRRARGSSVSPGHCRGDTAGVTLLGTGTGGLGDRLLCVP